MTARAVTLFVRQAYPTCDCERSHPFFMPNMPRPHDCQSSHSFSYAGHIRTLTADAVTPHTKHTAKDDDCESSHPICYEHRTRLVTANAVTLFLRNVRILTTTAQAVTHFHTNAVPGWRLPTQSHLHTTYTNFDHDCQSSRDQRLPTQSHLNTKSTPKWPDCISSRSYAVRPAYRTQ